MCVSSVSRLITRKSPSGICRTCPGIYREVRLVSQFTGRPYVIFFSSKSYFYIFQNQSSCHIIISRSHPVSDKKLDLKLLHKIVSTNDNAGIVSTNDNAGIVSTNDNAGIWTDGWIMIFFCIHTDVQERKKMRLPFQTYVAKRSQLIGALTKSLLVPLVCLINSWCLKHSEWKFMKIYTN